MKKCPPRIHNLNKYNNRFGECKRMSRKIICFLHDIDESFSSMINVAKSWLLDMLNECTTTSTKHIPSIWRKAKVIAIPKPGKDPSSPKSYRPISLLCIPYKLYERLILMRISPLVDEKLTKDQAGFRPGRSCAGPQLDSAHRRRLRKKDVNRCSICRPVSCIRHSSTSTNDKKADGHDWRHRSMPGDSRPSQQSPLLRTAKWQEEPMEEPEERTAARKCLSPLTVQHLYLTINICLRTAAGSYIYADDLCITTQQSDFQHVEQTLELALDEMSILFYYSSNHLKPNPAKTQICCFHLRNRDAKRKLDVTWNGLELDHYPNLIYLGVTLDRWVSSSTLLTPKQK